MEGNLIYNLERELPTNELLGRKFFRDLAKWIPELRLSTDAKHENQYWGEYEVVLPFALDVENMSDADIQISVKTVKDVHFMSICFAPQDPNNTTLPLRSRALLQHLINQVKAYHD